MIQSIHMTCMTFDIVKIAEQLTILSAFKVPKLSDVVKHFRYFDDKISVSDEKRISTVHCQPS